MNAESAGWSGIGKVEVEVEDVLLLHLQLLANQVQEQVAFLQLILDDAKNGQHVLLLAKLHAIVYLTVEVDGEVADLQQGAANMQELCDGLHHILRAHNDAACKGEWTIEPSAHDGTAINLCIEANDAAISSHLSIWFDAESRRVAMCTNHVEASLAKRFCANTEGIDGRVVLREEELLAWLHLAKFVAGIKSFEASLLELLTDVLDCQEVHRRVVEELQKGVNIVHSSQLSWELKK